MHPSAQTTEASASKSQIVQMFRTIYINRSVGAAEEIAGRFAIAFPRKILILILKSYFIFGIQTERPNIWRVNNSKLSEVFYFI